MDLENSKSPALLGRFGPEDNLPTRALPPSPDTLPVRFLAIIGARVGPNFAISTDKRRKHLRYLIYKYLNGDLRLFQGGYENLKILEFYFPGGNCGKNFSHLHPDRTKGRHFVEPELSLALPKDIFPINPSVITAVTERLVTKAE
jgi:hypothetical protein